MDYPDGCFVRLAVDVRGQGCLSSSGIRETRSAEPSKNICTGSLKIIDAIPNCGDTGYIGRGAKENDSNGSVYSQAA